MIMTSEYPMKEFQQFTNIYRREITYVTYPQFYDDWNTKLLQYSHRVNYPPEISRDFSLIIPTISDNLLPYYIQNQLMNRIANIYLEENADIKTLEISIPLDACVILSKTFHFSSDSSWDSFWIQFDFLFHCVRYARYKLKSTSEQWKSCLFSCNKHSGLIECRVNGNVEDSVFPPLTWKICDDVFNASTRKLQDICQNTIRFDMHSDTIIQVSRSIANMIGDNPKKFTICHDILNHFECWITTHMTFRGMISINFDTINAILKFGPNDNQQLFLLGQYVIESINRK